MGSGALPMAPRRLQRLMMMLGLVLTGCTVSSPTERQTCLSDADCPGGICLADLTLSESYCARTCSQNVDCRAYEECRLSELFDGSRYPVCVDRVRACEPVETCNGLDDNCDETIDEACEPVTRCLDDEPCGTFVCQAPTNQAETLCAPKNEQATIQNFMPCTSADQCENGVCDLGYCSPMCNGRDFFTECPESMTCARAVGDGSRPRYNACQEPCNSDLDCDSELSFVWRDVHEFTNQHYFVCAPPGPGRLPLGADCPNNTPEGDDMCASGLCYQLRCTRSCSSLSDPCTDVSAGLVCQPKTLFYGDREYTVRICAEDS